MSAKLQPDFLVISALQIEHAAVLKRLSSHRNVGQLGAVYANLGTTPNAPAGVALPITEAGRINAAVLTTKALTLWQPQVTLLVGLSGGFQSAGVSLGDVLVATEILDFELQKMTTNETEIRWRTFAPSEDLLNCAVGTARENWPQNKGNSPRVHFGPMLSGEKIVASSSFAKILQTWRHDALGVEMEGSGVATAVNHSQTRFMMIRGVADFSDESKSDSYQQAACDAAAGFSAAVLSDWFANA